MGIVTSDDKAFLIVSAMSFTVPKGIKQGLLDVGPELMREVKRRIQYPPKTGRVYIIGGKRHQASAPGEAPANLTGNLVRSVRYTVPSDNRLVIGEVKSAPYAKYLEKGSPGGKILPRPHLKPAVANKAREIEQAIQRGVFKEIGKVTKVYRSYK